MREAVAADLQRAGQLTADAYLADGLLPPDSDYLDELRDAVRRAALATVLVAVDKDDRVIGTVTVALAGTPYAEIAHPGEAEVRMLAVDPEARGRGVGERLVRAALERGIEGGAGSVILSSMPAMTTAHRMYERIGLRRVPERDWPIVGQIMRVYAT